MTPTQGLAAYRSTQVQSRTPLELVVMLYDGALRFIGTARDAVERRDIAARREALDRAMAIVSELQSTLNMDAGGELAARLDGLYDYVNDRLITAAMQNSVEPLDEARKVLDTLRDGWSTIAGGRERTNA
jgi:flagellar protein FliS